MPKLIPFPKPSVISRLEECGIVSPTLQVSILMFTDLIVDASIQVGLTDEEFHALVTVLKQSLDEAKVEQSVTSLPSGTSLAHSTKVH